ncbi:hypothetical protein [Stenotrophomonas sp. PS02301]|uniref:hypothetical protein n=1 Tax=Stenotrophomonas sp. PS02301 TaxID=2991427 RepID=UPI00249B37FF|nr:hypothetical protein [Stenotrophomonas sp. PS02301]
MRAVLITTLLAVVAAGSASASDLDGNDGRTTHLYQERSNPGESMDEFVARISTQAIAVTDKRRVSLCGVIGQNSDSYSIRIGTSNTWKRCEIDLGDTGDGFTSTGVTFHTHTSDEDSVRGFSAQEFNRPRGYIAYGKVVRYQEGRTKDRPVKTR